MPASLRKFQNFVVEASQAVTACAGKEFTDGLIVELNKHKGRVEGIVKIITRVITEEMRIKQWPTLKKGMSQIEARHNQLKEAASKHGAKFSGQKSKRARTA